MSQACPRRPTKQESWKRIDEALRRIKEAGIREVGEKLKVEHYCGAKQTREQVEAEYKRKQRWLERHRRKYPGW